MKIGTLLFELAFSKCKEFTKLRMTISAFLAFEAGATLAVIVANVDRVSVRAHIRSHSDRIPSVDNYAQSYIENTLGASFPSKND